MRVIVVGGEHMIDREAFEASKGRIEESAIETSSREVMK